MEKSVYLLEVSLSFYVRASSEKSANDLVYGLLISRGDKLPGHAVKLETLNMEQRPDGERLPPWEGEMDAEEPDEKPPPKP